MQTWAKRGMHAALVTGGMLAVGTGVASATETCPDRPAPPLGESLLPAIDGLGEDAPQRRACFAGELFPEEPPHGGGVTYNRPVVDQRSAHPPVRTSMSGTIDPVRDLLPAVEDAHTREIPVVRDQHWITSPEQPRMELAGWVADTDEPREPAADRSDVLFGPAAPERQVPVGTPAQGFHRSLSWGGPIGSVIGAPDQAVFRTGPSPDVAHELVTPAGDPARAEGFDHADGIVELWQEARERHQVQAAPLLAPEESVDLTASELPGEPFDIVGIPDRLLADALTTERPAPAPRQDLVPLAVPGEHQAKAAEIPPLSDLGLLSFSKDQGTTERSGRLETPLPVLGDLTALQGGQTSLPQVSRIAAALDGPAEPRGGFLGRPELAPVDVLEIDELTAAVPPQRRLTESPLRIPGLAPAPRAEQAMALPMLERTPTLRPGSPDLPANPDLEDTVVLSRI
ncbi:hypothetical protein [Saccharopolyspora taberi]|uniref:Uncharacterized protein n=1 Tax=Saccharopolyspora taberi TaxID=60895 RepID=A0ABN3VPX8_9PSEU